MKRFVISVKYKEINFIKFAVPTIKVIYFNYPKRRGAYCADNGTLWEDIDDNKSIFADEDKAKERLAEIMQELLK